MIRGVLTLSTFVSAILFPWPFTAFLAFGTSLLEPLVPLAVGLFADTLYYIPQAGSVPLSTIYGALLTALAFFVRSRLKTSIIS